MNDFKLDKVNCFVTHHKPHLDELVAVWLFRNYGTQIPGVKTARFSTWGKKELRSTTPAQDVQIGRLLLGLGGGMFDEHSREGGRTECTATLVAKFLGVDKDPRLSYLLKCVFLVDSKDEGPLKGLADQIKDFNRYWTGSIDIEKVYERFEPCILVELAKRDEFLQAKEMVFKRYRRNVAGFWIMAADKIENRQYARAARGHGGDVVVQRNTDGQTQVFGFEGFDMPALAVRVRQHELYLSRTRPQRRLTDADLSAVGTLPEIRNWYFEGDNLLNGSESYPDQDPSVIPFDELVRLVELHARELAKKKQGEANAGQTPAPQNEQVA
jgi:hypothetical protein